MTLTDEAPGDRRSPGRHQPMYVEPYQTCQNCGRALERATVYQRHAHCGDCTGSLVR